MAGQLAESPACDGISLFRAVLTGELLIRLKAKIDSLYRNVELARQNGDAAEVTRLIGVSERFVPAASSFTIGAISSETDIRELLALIVNGPSAAWLRARLGEDLLCNLDQSWVRRQYAPSRYPPLHAPHSWHQDGALKFDFFSHQNVELPPDALLNMVACWLALDSCGLEAPGIELSLQRFDGLLKPSELRNEAVEARFAPDKLWRPILQSGDALLFCGDILHRTHVLPIMTKDRTSIELRFFPATGIPERLQTDRFISVG